MKFSIRFADQIVGALVVLALAFLIFVFFMLGTTQRWFKRDIRYVTYFTSAQGLSANMAVKYKGFTIGNIKTITLKNDRVEVFFIIHEEYTERVKEGSLVEVQVSPIGLGNNFVFHPGNGTKILPEGAEIFEINSEQGKAMIKSGENLRSEQSDGISNIMTQVQVLLESLNVALFGYEGHDQLLLGQMMAEVNNTITSVSEIVKILSDHFEPIMGDVVKLTGQVTSPTGSIMSALDSQKDFYKGIERMIVSLSGVAASLEKTSAAIPDQIPELEVLIKQLNVTMVTMQDIITAVSNNPLLKDGIPERKESGPGGAGTRDMDFLQRNNR